MKTLDTMTKAALITLVEELQAKQTIRLSVGNETDNRGVVEYRFEDGQVTFAGKAEGEIKTITLDAVFSQPAVMAYLLRYAIKRATNDTCKTFQEVVERVELWERGYPTLAEYKAATRVEPVKTSKGASAKAPNIGGLTDAEIIACIESLGGEFDAIAATLMTVQQAMFAPSVKYLADKHPEVATALRSKVEAKRVEAQAAQQAALASIFG